MISGQGSEVGSAREDGIDPPRLLYPPPHRKPPGRRGSNLVTEIRRRGGHAVPDEFEIVSFMR